MAETSHSAEHEPSPRAYRTYCRVAAVLFSGVAVYTLLFKGLDGRMARDWLHTVLHVVSGLAAIYAGWARRPVVLTPFVYTVGIGATYLVLGVVGWFIDGLFTGSVFQVPLQAADNVFHDVLAAGAVAAVALGAREASRGGRAVDKRLGR